MYSDEISTDPLPIKGTSILTPTVIPTDTLYSYDHEVSEDLVVVTVKVSYYVVDKVFLNVEDLTTFGVDFIFN